LLIVTSTVVYLVLPRFEAANFGSRYGAADQYYRDKSWEQQADKPRQQDEPETDASSSDAGGPTSGAQGEGQSPFPMNNTGTGQNGQGSGESSGESSGQSEEQYRYRGFDRSFDIRGEQQPSRVPANVVVAYMRARHGAYLKVETFDEFDGVSWHKSRTSDVKRKLQFGEISLLDHAQPNYRQNITIEVNLGPYLPAAAVPVDLAFPATVISVDSYQMIKIPSGLRRGTRYTVDSLVQFAQGRMLAGDQVPPDDSDLQLPADLDARVQALAKQVTVNAATDLAKANRLEQHLRENYEYSLASVFESQNRTPVDRFLFEDKKGHCEYFASAMAVMLRSVGIPARLVTGFSATVVNPLTEYYEIRALDGHAWVEAWIDELGWAVYEPTPPYNLPVPEDKIISMERIQEYVDQLEQMQREHGLEGEVSLQSVLISLWQTLSTTVVILLSYIKLVLVNGWKWLVAAVAVFIIALFLWRRWKPYFMKGLSYLKVLAYKPRDTKAAVRFYLRHIQAVMRINGTARQPGATIEQYTRDLNDAAEENPLMQKVVSLINQTYYAPEAEVTLDPLILKQVFFQVYKKS
jgi:transglutaminase-like putative cysteine protease